MRFDPVWRLQRSTTLALILSPAGILVIAAGRLLIIAGYSPVTASAIVTSDGYVNALLGSVLPVIPLVMPYLALVLLFFRRFLAGTLAALTAALISPSRLGGHAALQAAADDLRRVGSWCTHHQWILALATVAAISLIALVALGLTAFARTAGTIAALALTTYVAAMFPLQSAGYYQGLLRLPWMPAEDITLTSGSTQTGYVLADTNVSMKVLLSSTRAIVFYPNRQVAGQRICTADAEVARPPLIRLAPAAPAAPACAQVPLTSARPGSPAGPATRRAAATLLVTATATRPAAGRVIR
ncbi:MAG TPA: hypothetical protein VGI64_14075 [Streptosporangiaceae bacterium]